MSASVETVTQSVELVEIRIPAQAEWVAVARLAVAAVAHRMPFSLEEIEDLKLAIAEACTTAIQYAQVGGSIDIVCRVTPEALQLTVRDRSRNAPPAGNDTEDMSELGLILIEALMDEVHYDPAVSDGGSRLEMIKRVQA